MFWSILLTIDLRAAELVETRLDVRVSSTVICHSIKDNKTGNASVLMPQYDDWYEIIFSTLLPLISDSTGVIVVRFVTYHFRQVNNWYVAEARYVAERISKFEGEQQSVLAKLSSIRKTI